MLSRAILRPSLRPLRSARPQQSTRQISDIALSIITDPPVPIYVLIPLATFAVRATLTLPLAIYSRRNTVKVASLGPLLQGWAHHFMRKYAKEKLPYKEWDKAVRAETKKKAKEIRVRQGVQLWKSFGSTAAGIPVWVSMSLFVRHLAGDLEGISALQGKGFGWIMDLGIPDTTGITGVIFASLMLANTEYNAKANMKALAGPQSKIQRIVTNALRLMAMFAIPISMGNAAILPLYWISSSSFTLVQNIVLDRLMPLPPSFAQKKSPKAELL